MTTTRIATVIPAYNAAASIEAAIASAREQTIPPAEIIVVDDGSTDATARLAGAAGVRVIQQANAGPGAARNRGIAATDAEWIALLDADDSWRPERIAHQLERIGEPRVAVIFSGQHFVEKQPPMPPPTIDFEGLWERNRIPTSSVLLRRAAWESVGGFDESRELIGVEDYNLWLRMAHAGWQFVGIPERLVNYQPSASSLTRQSQRFAVAEVAQLRQIATTLGLDAARVHAKEYTTYLQYGMELFYYGERTAAKQFLSEAARRGSLPPKARLQLWATHLPLARWRRP
ncbi:MAG: glycosyltransferase family A protein [Gemmatimonadales bacterium]